MSFTLDWVQLLLIVVVTTFSTIGVIATVEDVVFRLRRRRYRRDHDLRRRPKWVKNPKKRF